MTLLPSYLICDKVNWQLYEQLSENAIQALDIDRITYILVATEDSIPKTIEKFPKFNELGGNKQCTKLTKTKEFIKMGRKGTKLIPFLLDGLKKEKYRNDWYKNNNKTYIFLKHYTEAKQAITASLRKSDYVEKILIGDNKMTFRILSPEEVKKKKRKKQVLKKQKMEKQNESDASSGYGSDMGSPYNAVDNINENNEFLHAIKHDHDFGYSPIVRLPCDGNALLQNDIKIEQVDIEEKSVMDCGINFDIFLTNHTDMECLYKNAEDMECLYENAEDMGCLYESAEILADHAKFVACESEDNVNLSDEVQNQGRNIVSLDELMNIPLNDFLKCVTPMDFDLNELFSDGNIQEVSKKPENRFICKKLDYLGDTPILFCEYLDSGVFTVDTSSELKIIYDEAMLNKIQNLNLKIKDYKHVNGHLLVILEPNAE
ncbi:uncharacterized protein CEXT_444301 [Caerostris extrusa]|uniref:Uncharacterized protein n=1 Tax=Caerostris extrusa TaxID=172846 RepID=A0AAV4Y5U7_CAEEX|nr:uncharacterized protein CEXT_444301 [Caerostris extrusa]